ncbi:MAG: hypothetical protein HUU21_41085, partial [Polyangiaceae bacterium]|nr:hypothetical protein [Polyangiaceae bacterium]
MHIQKISWVIAVVLAGCGPSQPPPTSPPAGVPATGAPERKAVTQGDCEAQGGSVVGDIGDGATHRPDYVCPSGRPPLGTIAAPAGGPMPIEGAVCCP